MIHTKQNGVSFICILFLLVTLSNNKCLAQSCEDLMLHSKADSLFKVKNYSLAKETFLDVVKTKHVKRVSFYYLAVCYNKLSLIDSAYHYLNIAANQGLKYQNVSYLETDSNLDSLRTHSKWSELKEIIKKNTLKQPIIDSTLLNELIIRKESDQKYRVSLAKLTDQNQIDSIFKLQKKIDLDNQRWLKKTVRKNGWLTISKVGKEGEHIAWLIVQHSDNNLKFQEKCLKIMAQLIDKNEIDRKNFAYLKDRVLINQGEKQLYGTQFSRTKEGDLFVFKPKPIKDEECVNARRSYMSLPTLEYYLESASKRYNSN